MDNRRNRINIHRDDITSQRSIFLHYPIHSVWNSSAPLGVSALLLFPSTALDRETHTTWLNSHKLFAFPVFFFLISLWLFLCLSTVQEEAGGDGSSGSDYKSTVLLLLMRSLKGVYLLVFTLQRGWADWYF